MSCAVLLPCSCPATNSYGCPPGASGCLAAQMVQGATYSFVFQVNDVLGVAPSVSSINKGLAGDANFGSPSVFLAPKGVQVTFVYKGQGSTVAGAAAEMQSVINSNSNLVSGSVTFVSASVGGQSPACPGCASAIPTLLWVWGVVALAVIVGIVLVLHEANS